MAEAKQERKSLRKRDEGEEPKEKTGAVRWIIGWIAIPALVLAAIFGFGLHLGANNPEAWYTRAVLWIAELVA
jgi:hypothetical protein